MRINIKCTHTHIYIYIYICIIIVLLLSNSVNYVKICLYRQCGGGGNNIMCTRDVLHIMVAVVARRYLYVLYYYVHHPFSQTSVLGNGRVAHRYGRSHCSVLWPVAVTCCSVPVRRRRVRRALRVIGADYRRSSSRSRVVVKRMRSKGKHEKKKKQVKISKHCAKNITSVRGVLGKSPTSGVVYVSLPEPPLKTLFSPDCTYMRPVCYDVIQYTVASTVEKVRFFRPRRRVGILYAIKPHVRIYTVIYHFGR